MRRLATVSAAALLAAGYAAFLTAQEGSAPAEPRPPAPVYQFRDVSLKDHSGALLRFKPATGEVWMLGGKWKRIPEKAKLPPGIYELIARPHEDGWYVARFDLVSGRAWRLSEQYRWVEAEESDEVMEPGPKDI